MQTVKATKALAGYQEGEVFSVDEISAAVLKDRGDVEFVDDAAPEAGGLGVRTTSRRSGTAITQVAEADYPESGVPAEETASEAGAVTKRSNKGDLVAAALAAGTVTHDDGTPLTEAELESLDKAELVAKLNLG